MMKRTTILILAITGIILPASAEDYYYIPEHKLETPPIFCAIDFEDSRLPNARSQLMDITKNAVYDWRDNLVDATDETTGWNFQFRIISLEEQENLFYDLDCDVNIFFERQPPEGNWDYLGYADSYLTFSDIYIFYLEPIYEYKGKTAIINGEEWEEAEVTGFKNNLNYHLHDTIRHEIGHSLGLDHPKFEEKHFVKISPNLYQSPSIMADAYELNIDGEMSYEITDYDVSSVVNLYGVDGINEINVWTFVDYVIIGIVLAVIIFFINRKFRKKEPEFIPIDD